MTEQSKTEKLRRRMVEQTEDILKAGSYDPVTAHFLAINIVADNLQVSKGAGLKFVDSIPDQRATGLALRIEEIET